MVSQEDFIVFPYRSIAYGKEEIDLKILLKNS